MVVLQWETQNGERCINIINIINIDRHKHFSLSHSGCISLLAFCLLAAHCYVYIHSHICIYNIRVIPSPIQSSHSLFNLMLFMSHSLRLRLFSLLCRPYLFMPCVFAVIKKRSTNFIIYLFYVSIDVWLHLAFGSSVYFGMFVRVCMFLYEYIRIRFYQPRAKPSFLVPIVLIDLLPCTLHLAFGTSFSVRVLILGFSLKVKFDKESTVYTVILDFKSYVFGIRHQEKFLLCCF